MSLDSDVTFYLEQICFFTQAPYFSSDKLLHQFGNKNQGRFVKSVLIVFVWWLNMQLQLKWT